MNGYCKSPFDPESKTIQEIMERFMAVAHPIAFPEEAKMFKRIEVTYNGDISFSEYQRWEMQSPQSGYNLSRILVPAEVYLFDPRMAKVVWGEERTKYVYYPAGGTYNGETVELVAWQYHLQQLVSIEDRNERFRYLVPFIFPKNKPNNSEQKNIL